MPAAVKSFFYAFKMRAAFFAQAVTKARRTGCKFMVMRYFAVQKAQRMCAQSAICSRRTILPDAGGNNPAIWLCAAGGIWGSPRN